VLFSTTTTTKTIQNFCKRFAGGGAAPSPLHPHPLFYQQLQQLQQLQQEQQQQQRQQTLCGSRNSNKRQTTRQRQNANFVTCNKNIATEPQFLRSPPHPLFINNDSNHNNYNNYNNNHNNNSNKKNNSNKNNNSNNNNNNKSTNNKNNENNNA
jgi:superfamily II DNA/RNA helicase